MSTFKGTPGPWTKQPEYDARGKMDGWFAIEEAQAATVRVAANVRPADAAAIAQVPAMVEAIATFSAWLEREEKGGEGQPWREQRGTPEGEAAWSVWYQENLRLCDLAQVQAKAVLAALREGGAV